MPDFLREAQELFAYSQSHRRDFHMHPELGFEEVRTAGIVARELGELGIEVTTGVGKTGVVGLLEGEKPGPTILVRFDMDALPIVEDTGAEYTSQNPGVMHACGHDAHVAIGLTTAKLLYAHRGELKGSVKFMFQPAEEILGGAKLMMSEGLLENPKPEKALSLHVWNDRPVGWVGISPGPVMASSGRFIIKIIGKGGHGATPHITIDPVLAGAHLVTALQSVISRNLSPLQSGVLSTTWFHAGDAFNIIPQTAEIRGTIRVFEQEVFTIIEKRITELAHGVCEGFGCKAEVDILQASPPVVNDVSLAEQMQQIAARVLPEAKVATNYQTMGSEDMSLVQQKIPGCYMFVGSAFQDPSRVYGHHHPKFDIDEQVLTQGAALITAAVYDLLS